MDDNELASSFAAKKEWEEKETLYKERIDSLEETIDSIEATISQYEALFYDLCSENFFFGSKYREILAKFSESINL